MKSRLVIFVGLFSLVVAGLGLPGRTSQASQSAPETPPPSYQVIYLSELDNGYPPYVMDVNDYGQVVGHQGRWNAGLGQGEQFGYVWDDGQLAYLGDFDGHNADASGINNLGVIVGSDGNNAVRWVNGQMEVLSADAHGEGVNNSGLVVGGYYYDLTFSAYRWENGLRSLIGGVNTWAYRVNDHGDAVGFHDNYPDSIDAVLYPAGGSAVTLPGAGGYWTEAYSINNLGQVVGYAEVTASFAHPALWISGTLSTLANLGGSGGVANDINDLGEIVGRLSPDSGYTAVLWQPDGTLVDLNEMLPAGSSVHLTNAVAISQNGQIAAEGYNGGVKGIYLLVPAECPTRVCLEVSQGIQNRDNEMPLIAGRATIVRAFLYDDPAELEPQSALLRAFDAGTGVELPDSPIPAANNGAFILTDGQGGDRLNIDHGPWFLTPRAWRSGSVRFEVEVTYLKNGSQVVKKTGKKTAHFQIAEDLHLMMVPLHLHEHGDPAQPVQTFDYAYAIPIILSAYRHLPVANIQAHLAPLYFPGGKAHDGVTPEYNLSTKLAQVALVGEMYELAINSPFPSGEIIFTGMVHPGLDTGTTAGIAASVNTRGIWAAMSPDTAVPWLMTGGETLAHEIGHARKLPHVLCKGTELGVDPNYPWLAPCRLAEVDPKGYYGLDVYYHFFNLGFPSVLTNDPSYAESLTAYPLMGYREYSWVSPYEYCKLLPDFGVPCGLNWTPPAPAQPYGPYAAAAKALLNVETFLVARGTLDTQSGTANLERVYQMEVVSDGGGDAALADTLLTTPQQSWSLVQLDINGAVLAEQPVLLDESSDAVGSEEGFLEVMALAPGVVKVELRLDGVPVAEKAASANPPQVTLAGPNGGETLAPGALIEWSAVDADDDPLTFDLLYSRDDGQTWQAFALGISGSSYSLPSLQGFPGTLQGRMRVRANDGFYSVTDDSDAAFSVPDAHPFVYLWGAESEAAYPPGSPVPLSAYAMDPEDGLLDGNSLSWSSDLDGALGTGAELLLADLSFGRHTITVSVTDSAGHTVQASRVVLIGWNLFLPVMTRLP